MQVESAAVLRIHGHRLRALLAVAGYVFAYVLLDWISYVQPVLKLGITPWNPQAGLTLAFLAVAGPAFAPAAALAALIAEVMVRATPTSMPSILAASAAALVIAAGYGAAAVALRRRNLLTPPETPGGAAALILIATLTALPVACLYVLLFLGAGLLPDSAVPGAVARYWVGDVNGVLTVTPLLLALPRWRTGFAAVRQRHREVALQAVVVLACIGLMFGLRDTGELRFFYSLFVPVIWIAVRWGVPGGMLATCAIQIGLIAGVRGGPVDAQLIDLQFLLLTLAMTALVLGAVVTGRHAAEARLREQDRTLARAMRTAVAGELATALTHELNQPITALVSYLRAAEILAQPLGEQDPRLSQTLSKAAGQAIRTADVLKRLRDFYRGGTAPPESVPVDEVVAATLRAFQPRIRQADVNAQVSVEPDLPEVMTDRIGIEVVLHNLVSNALDALDEVAGVRRLEIGVRRDGNGIVIDVDDSGPGCSADVRSRLFEPFVTTKPDGMGLGLSISRSLLRSQGGDLWALPSALGGARFSLRVPDRPVAQTAV
jgi:signal transduction histidine kinase